MRRFIQFFISGPGAILVVIGLILWVCWVIKQGQDKEKAEAAKRQVQRQLGEVNPKEDVDKSTAPKDVLLSDRRLNGMQPNLPPTRGPTIPPAAAPQQRQALQPLVSFYAQVTATPIPSATPPPSLLSLKRGCRLARSSRALWSTRSSPRTSIRRWWVKFCATCTRTGA